MRAYAPNGALIVGSSEYVLCRAEIAIDSFTRDDDGKISFDWAGETKVNWDCQENVSRLPEYRMYPSGESPVGKFVYQDEDGEEWREDQITLKDENE